MRADDGNRGVAARGDLAALEGGAVLSPEDRHSVLEALLHVVYENRYDGAFYDGRQVSPLPAVEGVMHEVQETGEVPRVTSVAVACEAVCSLVRTHPEGLLPAQFVRQYLQAKSPPIDTEHAARAAEDAVFHHQDEGTNRFWQSLMQHLGRMVKGHVTSPAQAAAVFAPLMLRGLSGAPPQPLMLLTSPRTLTTRMLELPNQKAP
ncbi:hypothetical protein CYMTET_49573, partial [Cymbomonas tetramitiformis]